MYGDKRIISNIIMSPFIGQSIDSYIAKTV